MCSMMYIMVPLYTIQYKLYMLTVDLPPFAERHA